MRYEWKKGIHVSDYGKIAGRGFIAFSIALGVDDVYDTYKNGGDVWGEVGKEALEIIAAVAVGAAFTFAFSPVGWVVLAATAIAEGVVIAFASDKVGEWGEEAGDRTKELFGWSEKNIKHWL